MGEHGDLDGVVACEVGGVMGRDRLKLLSLCLRSSTSRRRFRIYFAGSGAVEEAALERGDDDARRSRRGGSVLTMGSVWALVERVAGLPRLHR